MQFPIHQQVVVITGASSGIGRETAIAFARKPRQGERTERRTMFAAGKLDPSLPYLKRESVAALTRP